MSTQNTFISHLSCLLGFLQFADGVSGISCASIEIMDSVPFSFIWTARLEFWNEGFNTDHSRNKFHSKHLTDRP